MCHQDSLIAYRRDMRTRWLQVLVMLVVMMSASACTTQGVDRARRWPAHRTQGDARFAELERQNADLAVRIAKLEDWVARAKKASPDAPAASPPPP